MLYRLFDLVLGLADFLALLMLLRELLLQPSDLFFLSLPLALEFAVVHDKLVQVFG